MAADDQVKVAGLAVVTPLTGANRLGLDGVVSTSKKRSSVLVPVVLLAVTVKVFKPEAADVVETFRNTELVGATLLVLRLAEVPAPPPLTDKLTGSENVPKAVKSIV